MAGLCAKVSKADGVVSENEIRMFKNLFNTEKNPQIARIFNQAKQSADNYEEYTLQLKVLSQNNIDMKETIIENLFKIGIADGEIKIEELKMFDNIAEILEIPQGNYSFIKNRFISKPKTEEISNYYDILGVFYNASNKEIKKRWIELINENHPDKIQASGGSQSDIDIATQKMAAINNAYEQIMKQRKVV
jgi:DnaJ like chaperone protein